MKQNQVTAKGSSYLFEERIDQIAQAFDGLDQEIISALAPLRAFVDRTELLIISSTRNYSNTNSKDLHNQQSHAAFLLTQLRFLQNHHTNPNRTQKTRQKGLSSSIPSYSSKLAIYRTEQTITKSIGSARPVALMRVSLPIALYLHTNIDIKSILLTGLWPIRRTIHAGCTEWPCKRVVEIFRHPHGLAIHPQTHRVYIPDALGYNILVFSPTLSREEVISVPGSPIGLAFSSDGGTLFVTELNGGRFHLYQINTESENTPTKMRTHPAPGKSVFLRSYIAGNPASLYIDDPAELRSGVPVYPAVDADDLFYIPDIRLGVISVFRKDGTFHRLLCPRGSPPFRIRRGCCMVVDDQNRLLLLPFSSNTVHVFCLETHKIVRTHILRHILDFSFLARGPDGGFVVSDPRPHGSVDFYSADGTHLSSIRMDSPVGAAFNPSGNLFVVSSGSMRPTIREY